MVMGTDGPSQDSHIYYWGTTEGVGGWEWGAERWGLGVPGFDWGNGIVMLDG